MKKNARLFLLLVVGLALLLGCLWLLDPLGLHSAPERTDFLCVTQQEVLSLREDAITITVTNKGSYSGEIQKPILQVWDRGKWRTMTKDGQVQETMELLGLMPGETKEFPLYLSPYRDQLVPGQYRAVFHLVQEDGFFAHPFQLANL